MANALESLINTAISYVGNEKIKLDSDKAADISARLGKISSDIEVAATQIEGPISESQSFWTGAASENFCTEIKKLISETKEISEKVRQNRQQLDTAVSIIVNADKNVAKDVGNLPTNNIFIN